MLSDLHEFHHLITHIKTAFSFQSKKYQMMTPGVGTFKKKFNRIGGPAEKIVLVINSLFNISLSKKLK
jgi:hypothetical protein